jgi:DNA helicase II / ATP-dependent DNA helicase PcrA
MLSNKNKLVIACAGAGKTTRLVREALTHCDRRIVMVTYTNNNVREINKKFGELNSGVPKHVHVMTWFEFLLRECARPYQRAKYDQKRIESLLFVNERSAKGIAESDTARHYFVNDGLIYSDKIARFVIECEKNSSKAVTARLGEIYTDVFIDEFQDLAGWDLDVIEMFLRSDIRVTLVGDPRQHIYSTNRSNKNRQYLGIKVVSLVEQWKRSGLCDLDPMSGTYRCNQGICDFSNALWPGMDIMTPFRNIPTDHDGVFLVAKKVVAKYIQRFRPQVLRYSKKANTYGCEALNFGLSKGLQFERVLIIPTGPIRKYLETGDIKHVENSRDKLHVAATRAQHSVAFVFDEHSPIVQNRWEP